MILIQPVITKGQSSLGIPAQGNFSATLPTQLSHSLSFNSMDWLDDIADELIELTTKETEEQLSFVPNTNIFEKLEERFRFVEELGTGATSRVVLAQNLQSMDYVALKQLRKDDENNIEVFITEYKLLQKVSSHKHIASFNECYIDKFNYYISSEYCAGGRLLDFITNSDTFSEQQASKYISTILKTIKYCHSKNIIHRDLKPGNILFNKTPEFIHSNCTNDDTKTNDSKTEVKGAKLMIIDFGIAIEIGDNEINEDYVGTLLYMPPESCRQRYGWELKKGDIWSIGIIAYILVCGCAPFLGANQARTITSIMKDDVKFPKQIKLSKTCKTFITKLLTKEPDDRYDAGDALKDPWIMNWEKQPTKALGAAHKNSLRNFEKSVNFEYLVVNATLSSMVTTDKQKVIHGLKNIQDNDNNVEKEIITKYLIKKGLTKETAECRANDVMKMIQNCPVDTRVGSKRYNNESGTNLLTPGTTVRSRGSNYKMQHQPSSYSSRHTSERTTTVMRLQSTDIVIQENAEIDKFDAYDTATSNTINNIDTQIKYKDHEGNTDTTDKNKMNENLNITKNTDTTSKNGENTTSPTDSSDNNINIDSNGSEGKTTTNTDTGGNTDSNNKNQSGIAKFLCCCCF